MATQIVIGNGSHIQIDNDLALSATSDAVGTTTIANLLTWGETRQLQIQEAELDYGAAVASDAANSTTNAEGKTWRDYDPNYS